MSCSVQRFGDRVVIEATANAFLQHMVRNLVGLLLDVGVGKAPPQLGRRGAGRARPDAQRADGPRRTGCTSGRCATRRPSGCPRRRPGRYRLSSLTRLPGRSVETAMSWFEKIMPSRIKTERRTRSVPEGLWSKCPACDAVLYRAELERNLYVCPKCSHHTRIGARQRLNWFLDEGEKVEIGAGVQPEDILKFKDSKRYKDRLAQAQKATGEKDALVVLAGTAARQPGGGQRL